MTQSPSAYLQPSRLAATVCAGLASIALCGMVVTMVADVIGRYLFNHPVPGAGEVIELLLAVTVFAAFPLATATKEHIRLDYLEMAFAPRRRHLVRVVNWLVSAVVLGFLAWRVAVTSSTIMRYGDTTAYLNIPIAPFAIFISAMIAASAAVMAYLAWIEIRNPGSTVAQGAQL